MGAVQALVTGFRLKILKCLGVLFLCAHSSYALAGAAPEVSPGCDPDFWDVLESRTWLEGKREFEAAQRLILKPDSVLELSCFDDRLTEVGVAANTMFSDNVYSSDLFTIHPPTTPRPPFGPPAIPQPPLDLGLNYANPPPDPPGQLFQTELDVDLREVVYEPMFQFLLQNFAHRYAGGTFVSGTPATVCDPMQAVWDFLRCSDFDKSLFRRLNEMSLLDLRDLPGPLAPPNCNDTSRGSTWTSQLAAAFPDPDASYPAAQPGGVEPAVTYNTSIAEDGCSGTPILTGITVTEGGASFPDAVCSNPSCYYDGSGACN